MLGKSEQEYSINKRLCKLNKERMELLVDYHSLNNHKDLGKRFPMSILIVEDQIINQRVIVSQLNKIGYSVQIVNNGLEAVHAFEQKFYDMVFMDIEMPVMNGVEATKKILHPINGKQPFVVAYTTRCSEEDLSKYNSIGIKRLLTKPASINSVVDVILDAVKQILVEA